MCGKRRGKSPPLGSHTKNTLTWAAAKPHSEPNPKTTGSDVAPHSGWPGHGAHGAASSAGAGGLGFAEPGKGHISGLTKKTPGSGTSALRPRPGGRVANGPWAVRGNGQFSGRCLGSRGRLIETPAPQGPLPTLGTAAPEKARRQLCWVPLASHGGRTGTRLGPGTMDLPSRPIPRGGVSRSSVPADSRSKVLPRGCRDGARCRVLLAVSTGAGAPEGTRGQPGGRLPAAFPLCRG